MTQFRVRRSASMALVLALALTQTGRAQSQRNYPGAASTSTSNVYSTSASAPMSTSSGRTASVERSYKIYSLDEFSGDSSLGEWITQTIREVIAAGTWNDAGVIRYYAPKNILVIYHTSAVQAKVDGFLKDLKKSLPSDLKGTTAMRKSTLPSRDVVPAEYRAPALLKSSGPAPEPSLSYPVPAQPKTPKHLFHFIIRYEGEGLVDDNIVKAMKAYYQMEKKASEAATSAGACHPPVCVPSSASGGSPMPSVLPAGYATPASSGSYSGASAIYAPTPPNVIPNAPSAAAAVSKNKKKEDKKGKEED